MRNENTRFETFDHRWPASQINAAPRDIARAGFFFLGEWVSCIVLVIGLALCLSNIKQFENAACSSTERVLPIIFSTRLVSLLVFIRLLVIVGIMRCLFKKA